MMQTILEYLFCIALALVTSVLLIGISYLLLGVNLCSLL
jgi:hypothetical protein